MSELKVNYILLWHYTNLFIYTNFIWEDESLDLDTLLIKLGGRLDTQWYPLGMAIGIPTQFLENLKGYSDEECMVEMLDYWLRHHPDQPTWKEIADAIEDIQDYDLAKSIKGVYELASKFTATS